MEGIRITYGARIPRAPSNTARVKRTLYGREVQLTTAVVTMVEAYWLLNLMLCDSEQQPAKREPEYGEQQLARTGFRRSIDAADGSMRACTLATSGEVSEPRFAAARLRLRMCSRWIRDYPAACSLAALKWARSFGCQVPGIAGVVHT